PDELRAQLLQTFQKHLELKDGSDVAGFDASLGLDERGWVPFDAPEGSERWQILSPGPMQPHGVHDINPWVQPHFRAKELEAGTRPWGLTLGDENIVRKDKIIQTSNQHRNAYDGKASEKHYIANGEVGLAATDTNGWMNVVFAGRPGLRF